MASTTPWNIPLIEGSKDSASLKTRFDAQANALNNALTNAQKQSLPTVDNEAGRSVMYPNPVQGDGVYRRDLGYEERYFEAYSVSNPGGRATVGWQRASAMGVIARVARNTATNVATNTETFIFEISSSISLPGGAKVRLSLDGIGVHGSATAELRFRYTTDGTAPTTTSAILPFGGLARLGGVSGLVTTRSMSASHVMAGPGVLRVAVTYTSLGAAGGIFNDSHTMTMAIE